MEARQIHILLVDTEHREDAPDWQQRLAPNRDLHVERSGSLPAVLSHLQDTRFDLIFLSGIRREAEGIEEIRFLALRVPQTPIVFLCADPGPSVSSRAFEAGADYCICTDGLSAEEVSQRLDAIVVLAEPLNLRKKEASIFAEARVQFAQLLDNSPDGTVIVDANGRVRFANRPAERLLGPLEVDQEFGLPLGDARGIEVSVRSPESRDLVVELRSLKIRWRTAPAHLVTLRDVTHRVQQELRLRELNSLLESIVENAPVMIFLKNADDFKFELWNKKCIEILGIERDSILGTDGYDRFTKEEADGFIERDREVLRSGTLKEVDETVMTAAGERILHTKKVPLYDENGRVRFVLGLSEDRTVQKRAERLLLQRERALESVTSGVLISDPGATDCPIVYCNRAFSEITGYSKEDIIGRNCRFLQGDDREQDGLPVLRRAIQEERSCIVELRNYRKDGTLFLNRLSISPVVDEEGRCRHFVGVINDVTEERRRDELERERRALADSLKGLEQILGVVGHELRTPLGCLQVISELLLGRETGDEQNRKFIKTIHDESIRMGEMVANLLEVARLNSGTVKWRWGAYRAKECIAAAVGSIMVIVPPAVSFELVVEPEDLSAVGDGEAVGRLVLNLVSNSIKHTERGSVRVAVRGYGERGERWLLIEVSDTGSGIEESISGRVGEAFALNSGVIGSQYIKGSGLGLAICRGIVQAHGGAISIASTLGKGTTVSIKMRADLPAPCTSDKNGTLIHFANIGL